MDSSLSTSLPSTTSSPYFNSLARRRQQKKMSITQTYYLAHTARQKLTREAARADHDLRALVGHANMLDSLMLDLADAEQEQERWFNQTVTGASKAQDQRQVQWAETVVEDPEEDWDASDASDTDSDTSDDLDDELDGRDFAVSAPIPMRRRAPSPAAQITEEEVEDEGEDSDSDFEYDHGEDIEELTLTRSVARTSLPELLSDSDEDSEDDTMPPSPPQQTLTFDEKEAKASETALPLSDSEQPGLLEQGYYIPHRPQGTLIQSY